MAQAVAAEAPDRVSKLMLCNTWTRSNDAHLAMLHEWLDSIEKKLLIQKLDDSVPFIIHPDRLGDQDFLKTLQGMQHELSFKWISSTVSSDDQGLCDRITPAENLLPNRSRACQRRFGVFSGRTSISRSANL